MTRLNWVAEFLSGNQQADLHSYDPQRWIRQNSVDPSNAIESFSALLLQNDLNPKAWSLAQKLAGASKPNLPAAIQVLLQTPQYQLA